MAAKSRRPRHGRLQNERGTAMVETIPLLVIFVVLLGFGLGLFSVVHTAIMNSMAARAYAFETFRNRADLTIFRDSDNNPSGPTQFAGYGVRFHTVNDETVPETVLNNQYATARSIVFGRTLASSGNEQDHNTKIYEINGRNRTEGVSPAWVMVGYGICLNAACGDR